MSATPVRNWAENSGKNSPSRENIAIVWCPEGVGKVQFRQRDWLWGAAPAAKIVWPRISKEGTAKKTFFKIDGETSGGQGVEKSFQIAEVCLPVQRTHTGVVHVCKHTFQTVCGAVHHSLKGLCRKTRGSAVRVPRMHLLLQWNRVLLLALSCYNMFPPTMAPILSKSKHQRKFLKNLKMTPAI